MKLSKLIKQLHKIEGEYKGRDIEVLIVNEILIIREIIEDSDTCYSGAFITAIAIE